MMLSNIPTFLLTVGLVPQRSPRGINFENVVCHVCQLALIRFDLNVLNFVSFNPDDVV